MEATDSQRLLPGEQPGSAMPSDASHWIDVYTQLRQTKLQLVANLRELMKGQSPEAQDELQRSDVRVLELQVARFERRLSFWQSKLAGMDGHHANGQPQPATAGNR